MTQAVCPAVNPDFNHAFLGQFPHACLLRLHVLSVVVESATFMQLMCLSHDRHRLSSCASREFHFQCEPCALARQCDHAFVGAITLPFLY